MLGCVIASVCIILNTESEGRGKENWVGDGDIDIYTYTDIDLHVGTQTEQGALVFQYANVLAAAQKSLERQRQSVANGSPISKPCAGRIIMRLKPIYQRHDFICK